MKLVAEDIINDLIRAKIELPKMKHNLYSSWVLHLHNMQYIKKMINKIINMLIYVNDRAVIFNSRRELIARCRIMCKAMAKQGLTAHIRYNGKKSKIELIFFPSTSKLKMQRKSTLEIYEGNDMDGLIIESNKPKQAVIDLDKKI